MDVRVIDTAPAPIRRQRKMQVLCLGLSRTGTVSLKAALTKLGYHPYHYYETLEKENLRKKHFQCWREALRVHLTGKGIPYGRAEFDKLLGDYDAVTDTPCANFAKELIEAYPDAKVVLNTRDIDRWMNSVERSLWAILETPLWGVLRFLSFGKLGIPTEVLRMIMEDWTDGDWHNRQKVRQFYYDHYARVRAMVPPENLVEHTPKDGWEPLCKLLGHPVPKEPYPHENEGDTTWRRHFVGTTVMFTIFWGRIFASGAAAYYGAKYLGILKNFNLE